MVRKGFAMDRLVELRFVYDALKDELARADGSGAAAVARELRILSAELERLDGSGEVSKVDELAGRRRSGAGVARPASRRRKSG